MLMQIHIRDLATIEEQQLQLNTGCTMITGETGAGKSIFLEAIDLALGGRGSPNVIRSGKERADISLCFDISKREKITAWLNQHDLSQDPSECIIRRVISQDGRSRSYINGLPTTLANVRELGELLFHLHGQHEQQVILKPDSQRDMLDRYAEQLPLANEVASLAESWRALDKKISSLREKAQERLDRKDFLTFQYNELVTLQIKPGEWETLEAEHHKLTHSEELLRHLQTARQQLGEDESRSILSQLSDVRRSLEATRHLDTKAESWLDSLSIATIQLNDLESEIGNYLESAELDPERLQAVEQRVSQLFDLARKHKIQPNELITLQEKFEQELQSLESSDSEIATLETEKHTLAARYQTLAEQLSRHRNTSSKKLVKEITSMIRSLSLPHGEFQIQLDEDSSTMPIHGLEKITFLIKTNPDQSLQPLAKVISGGELSRLSLSLHLALAHQTSTPTLIFDEVDTGVSGATAEKIGKLLNKLGEAYQVFCVTHQAQVAACGHHHLLVEKCVADKKTMTNLRLLNKDEKTKEIARLLGGAKITDKTLAHAKELVEFA